MLLKCLALQQLSSVYWDTELDDDTGTINSSVDTQLIRLLVPLFRVIGARAKSRQLFATESDVVTYRRTVVQGGEILAMKISA